MGNPVEVLACIADGPHGGETVAVDAAADGSPPGEIELQDPAAPAGSVPGGLAAAFDPARRVEVSTGEGGAAGAGRVRVHARAGIPTPPSDDAGESLAEMPGSPPSIARNPPTVRCERLRRAPEAAAPAKPPAIA
jgi:hypothetical protein